MLVSSVDTTDIDLFPLNGDIVGFENGLDGLRNLQTDTITYNLTYESTSCTSQKLYIRILVPKKNENDH